jgi:hypothetical protein
MGKLNLGSGNMSPRKLTAADKKAIVSTYRSSAESTTALADRYGVSNSTISRLLKINIPEDEYELLISEKRSQRGESEEDLLLDLPIAEGASKAIAEGASKAIAEGASKAIVADASEAIVADASEAHDETESEEPLGDVPLEIPRLRVTVGGNRRVRRRSSATEEEDSPEQNTKPSAPKPITRAQKYSTDTLNDEPSELELDQYNEPLPLAPPVMPSIPMPIRARAEDSSVASFDKGLSVKPQSVISGASAQHQPLEPEEDVQQDLSMVASIFGEEMADMSDLLDEDEDDLPEEEGWSDVVLPALMAPEMQVLPLASATLPRTCYIVVDKFAELVACPLRDFVELGKVSGESPQNTLPVFDNQRVAKRFSNNRNQRVIKVPDSGVFYKTIDHLLAKGISLMLVDGRIYSLR